MENHQYLNEIFMSVLITFDRQLWALTLSDTETSGMYIG